MKKIIKLILTISAAMTVIMCSGAVNAMSEYCVYDDAGLLTEEECESLEQQLAGICEAYSHDIVVATVNSTGSTDIEAFTEQIYSQLNVGIDGSGIIYVVDMDNRKYDIYTQGKLGDEIIVGSLREEMASDLASYLSSGDYYTAFSEFGSRCQSEIEYYNQYGRSSDTYVPVKIGIFTQNGLIIGIIAGIIIAVIIMVITARKMNTLRFEAMADNYMDKNSLDINRSNDIFLYSSYTRVKRSSSDSSGGGSGHSSGSF